MDIEEAAQRADGFINRFLAAHNFFTPDEERAADTGDFQRYVLIYYGAIDLDDGTLEMQFFWGSEVDLEEHDPQLSMGKTMTALREALPELDDIRLVPKIERKPHIRDEVKVTNAFIDAFLEAKKYFTPPEMIASDPGDRENYVLSYFGCMALEDEALELQFFYGQNVDLSQFNPEACMHETLAALKKAHPDLAERRFVLEIQQQF